MLIVGGPERVPFHSQAVLDSAASVGRVAFDDLTDLQAYVEKVLRLEQGAGPGIWPEALIFATDHGRPDLMYYSRRDMAGPIARHVQGLGIRVTSLIGERATAAGLPEAMTAASSAVVYTASHGAGRPEGRR